MVQIYGMAPYSGVGNHNSAVTAIVNHDYSSAEAFPNEQCRM